MATRKVRYKKLNVKTLLPVLREDEIDASEYESLTNETQIATGVEQAEENEYHLQAALQNSGTNSVQEIPVPPPQESQLNYDELYPTKFAEPTNYIRFSQTVEECIGCQYDMTEDDDAFLKSYNQERAPTAGGQLSEDDFERIIEVYEDTASVQAPYASVDNTVVSYDFMLQGLHELEAPKLMSHAKEIYEYWKSQRQAKKGPLHPTLKFETHQDSDDMDPFVCFRRREVRQTRKTRQRDVQSADKLKRLRRELEQGRELITLAHDREMMKRELLNVDRSIFEQRAKIKATKIKLGIKTDDDDLFTTKPQRKKPSEVPQIQRPPSGPLRVQPRPDARSADSDLTLLADQLAEKENELRIDVENKIEHHRKWNFNFVDVTRDPLDPVPSQTKQSFRPAKAQYLLTPPTSASSEGLEEVMPMDLDAPEPEPAAASKPPRPPPAFRFRGFPQSQVEYSTEPREYRRRIGRLNRLWIDRRPLRKPVLDHLNNDLSDRWKYDQDDSDEDDPVIEVDPYDLRALKFRATIPLGNNFLRQNSVLMGSRPALPPSHGPLPVGSFVPGTAASSVAAGVAAAAAAAPGVVSVSQRNGSRE